MHKLISIWFAICDFLGLGWGLTIEEDAAIQRRRDRLSERTMHRANRREIRAVRRYYRRISRSLRDQIKHCNSELKFSVLRKDLDGDIWSKFSKPEERYWLQCTFLNTLETLLQTETGYTVSRKSAELEEFPDIPGQNDVICSFTLKRPPVKRESSMEKCDDKIHA